MDPFNLRDSRFDPSSGRMSSYFGQLFIAAGKDFFRFAILDTDRNSFIALADYSLEKQPAQPNWQEVLKQLVGSSEFLSRKYPAVVMTIESPYYSVIPSALYDADHIGSHLQLTYQLPGKLSFHSDFIPEIDAWNISGIDTELDMALKQHFPNGLLFHYTTPLIRQFSNTVRQLQGTSGVLLNFRADRFDMAVFSGHSLLLFNTFHFEAPEDVLYFTLYTVEQLKLRTNDIILRICGDTLVREEILSLLSEFIPSAGYLNRPEISGYSALLDFPSYQYYSLFSLAICGS